MYFKCKQRLFAFCLVILSYCVQRVPAYTVTENLNCYVTDKLDVSKTVEEDCHMHTGCLKRYDKKTQRVLEKSCFLTPGHNDTCFDDPVDSSIGICWCHTNLCNGGNRWSSPSSITTTLFLVSFLAWPGLWRINLMVWIYKRKINFNMHNSHLFFT